MDILLVATKSFRFFLHSIALMCPHLAALSLPLSTIVATSFVMGRMLLNREIITLFSAGLSHTRLSLHFLSFGVVIASITALNTLYFIPISNRDQLKFEEIFLQKTLIAFFQKQEFLSPIDGTTVYVRDIDSEQVFHHIFIRIKRTDDTPEMVYVAKTGYVKQRKKTPVLMLKSGSILAESDDGNLTVIDFNEAIFDLSEVLPQESLFTSQKATTETYKMILGLKSKLSRDQVDPSALAAAHYELSTILTSLLYSIITATTLLFVNPTIKRQSSIFIPALTVCIFFTICQGLLMVALPNFPDYNWLFYALPLIASFLSLVALNFLDRRAGMYVWSPISNFVMKFNPFQ
jgi:lipopolysaccharide export system permease protein